MLQFSNEFLQLLYLVHNILKSAFPKFATFLARLKTFDLYVCKNRYKYSLYEARFKYLDVSDYVQCWNCGLILKIWTSNDEPWIEHAF